MSGEFAKLFTSQQYGQILVTLDSNDVNEREVRFYTSPEGLGVCSVAFGFPDNDEGWGKAEAMFSTTDHADAEEVAETILKASRRYVDDGGEGL